MHRIVHRALDAGINMIDTADVYSQGSPRRSSVRLSLGAAMTSYSPRNSTIRWGAIVIVVELHVAGSFRHARTACVG